MMPTIFWLKSVSRLALTALIGLGVLGLVPVAGAATHTVPASIAKVDCATYNGGVKPGDAIVVQGTSRGPISFDSCIGTATAPISIRNDSSASGPLIIKHSGGGYMAKCVDCEYVVIDGTAKWSGAPAGTCGVSMSSGEMKLGVSQCGIVLQCVSGDAKGLWLMGSSRNVTVKGVEIDGNFPTCGTFGTGIFVNDHAYLLADHPGRWREGFRLVNNYIHETARSGIYFGPNQNDEGAGDLQVRNNEIAYNYVNKPGCDGIKYKSVTQGTSSIHHNYVSGTGQSNGDSSSGCTSNGILLFEAGYTDVFNNYVESPSPKSGGQGTCIAQVISSLPVGEVSTVPAKFYNNIVTNCKGFGISTSRSSSSAAAPVPTIYNNTVVSPVGGSAGILVGSSIASCTVRDNIVAGETIAAGACSQTKNLVGSVDNQKFKNSAGKDFRLTSSSPAVDAGSSQCPAKDHGDMPRPQSAACDQGAFEFGGSSTTQPNPPEDLSVN